jgi:hypothetical protein
MAPGKPCSRPAQVNQPWPVKLAALLFTPEELQLDGLELEEAITVFWWLPLILFTNPLS